MTANSPPALSTRFDPDSWSDASARDALRLITDSVTQMVGFEVAVLSLVRDDRVESVAVSGPEEVHEAMRSMSTPLDLIVEELSNADDWGRFRFLPHDAPQAAADYGWIPDLEISTDEDAWHPMDALLAPLYDESGDLLGLLSIDVPLNRRRPDAQQRQLLQRYAAQAERALTIAVEREALSHRVRLAETTRQVVRFAASQPDIERALDECRVALLEGFRADDLSIRTYARGVLPEGGSPSMDAPASVRDHVVDLARACWRRQSVSVMTPDSYDNHLIDPVGHQVLWDFVESQGYRSAMLVPIGAASWTLGHLILFRADETVPWTQGERQSCLEVARDIGQAVLNARNLGREQRLVGELRQLASYKTELLSTVSHELKNPLSAITGHLELVAAAPDLAPDVHFSVAAMDRASQRLVRLVDDLLTLAEVEDPDAPDAFGAIDLRPLLDSTLELAQFEAARRGLVIDVRVESPPGPVLVHGDPEGLERVLNNLVSNAVKYTPRGRGVSVSVRSTHRTVEIDVIDDGIGISEADQQRLFTEFFRSTNPEALAEPGTGLGLAISARILARHGGRIEVESTLGSGSTFRVIVPAAPAQPVD